MLGRNIFVLHVGGDLFCLARNIGRIAAHADLYIGATGARFAGQGLLHAAVDLAQVGADLVDHRRHNAAFLLQERAEQMLRVNRGMAILFSYAL